MDDSEKSYGYSEDIYHGQSAEKSYEYGPEGEPDDENLSPEEEAMRVVGPPEEEPVPAPDTPGYDYGRDTAGYGAVESFTWEIPGEGQEAQQEAETVPSSASATKPRR